MHQIITMSDVTAVANILHILVFCITWFTNLNRNHQVGNFISHKYQKELKTGHFGLGLRLNFDSIYGCTYTLPKLGSVHSKRKKRYPPGERE